MNGKLPTTREELQPWLEDQLATHRPDFPASTRWEMVGVVMGMVRSDAQVATFIEGWEAGCTDSIDPKRVETPVTPLKRGYSHE